jgi:exosortase A-associated hydrolase 1
VKRRHFTFACEGSALAATVDQAAGTTGLLVVTGGNELRSGAWSGQAQFAARIAAAGHPVLRFDRRGCGDSEGANLGFTASAADIAAALAAFRAECPALTRIAALGNCDAASALMLAKGEGCEALILSNPWTIEDDTGEAPPEAVRDHYKRRLADPAAIRRLLSGQVSLGKLISSVLGMLRPAPPPSGLAQDMKMGIAAYKGEIAFLVAERDRTGQAFLSAWDKNDQRIRRCADATHSYVEEHAREWLVEQVLEVLGNQK